MFAIASVLSAASTGIVVSHTTAPVRSATPMRADVSMLGAAPPDKNVWVTFAKEADCQRGEIVAGFQYGQELAIATTQSGKRYAVANKLPPTGQPATLGNIEGDCIVDPLFGTKFSLSTGQVQGPWCPANFGFIFGRLIPQSDLAAFKVRSQGGSVQCLINVNLKKQFEANYWRGILDSQGKVDGGYY